MIDEVAVTSRFAQGAMNLLPFALSAARGVVRGNDFVEFEFRKAHVEYCTAILKNYCKARTFFVRDDPQYLEEFYVPTSLRARSRGRARLERANLDSLATIGPHVIVDGNGGSGKTIFMRYLLLDSIERGIAYPVLFELRALNEDHELSLEDALLGHMKNNGFPLGVDYAKKALKRGHLVLLLDGLDEVNFSRRKRLAYEIKKIATSTDCRVVVSSRPDITLEGWDQFSRVRMAPLELEEACELVNKIRFDDDDGIKARFVASLKAGLFESHRSFLSNPLLLSIMLLTYGHSADIPKRFSSFYERAYIALFEKHDAYKGYRRQRETDLDISEFASLFSAFCTVTFNDGVFRFTSTEAVDYVKKARQLASARDISEMGFVEDAKQAVCLLIEDGLDLTFVHRSFQEYFAARYIQGARRDVQEALVKRYSSQRADPFAVDNVLKYLYELAPTLVEEFYLIPSLKKIFGQSYGRRLSFTAWKAILIAMFDGFHRPSDDGDVGLLVSPNRKASEIHNLFAFVRDVCIEDHYLEVRSSGDMKAALSDFVIPGETVYFDSFKAKSPVWRIIADSDSFYSMMDLDRIRAELSAMERRVENKRLAEDEFLMMSGRR